MRAILSWNYAPPANTPDFVPVWGNVVDAQIQVEGFEFILLEQFLQEAKIELPKQIAAAIDLNQPLKVASRRRRSARFSCISCTLETKVPKHRYLANLLTSAASAPALKSMSKPAIKEGAFFDGLGDVDLSAILASLLKTNGDTVLRATGVHRP